MNRILGNMIGRFIGPIGITICVAIVVSLFPARTVPTVSADRPGAGLATCAPDVQFLGFSEALNKTTFGGFAVGELSGIAFDQHNKLHYAVADRAGAVQAHYFTLDIPLGSESLGLPAIQEVTVLEDQAGIAYTGASFD